MALDVTQAVLNAALALVRQGMAPKDALSMAMKNTPKAPNIPGVSKKPNEAVILKQLEEEQRKLQGQAEKAAPKPALTGTISLINRGNNLALGYTGGRFLCMPPDGPGTQWVAKPSGEFITLKAKEDGGLLMPISSGYLRFDLSLMNEDHGGPEARWSVSSSDGSIVLTNTNGAVLSTTGFTPCAVVLENPPANDELWQAIPA